MDIRETIRKNLKYYLERSPYTQAEIARALGVSKMSVTKWMKGDNSPNIELLEPLCKLLSINITDVFEEHPEPAETLTTDEQQLVTDYRSFNDEGKEKVREYVADLKGNPRYKKRDEPAVEDVYKRQAVDVTDIRA